MPVESKPRPRRYTRRRPRFEVAAGGRTLVVNATPPIFAAVSSTLFEVPTVGEEDIKAMMGRYGDSRLHGAVPTRIIQFVCGDSDLLAECPVLHGPP
jgi:hypothetical protein